jgi:hypothetical protein
VGAFGAIHRAGLGEDGVELAEARDPQLLESLEQMPCVRQPVGIAADDAFAPLRALGDESGLFEHADVLLHGSE